MLTTLALTLVLTCKRPPHPEPVVHTPPPTYSACEGADRVVRDLAGHEVRRHLNACTYVRCEGSDYVRRTLDGAVTELHRAAWRCASRPQPRPQPPPQDVLRFGLSAR